MARDLAKTLRGRRVVDGVSVRIAPGEVVGLLGPNGAGKTTSFHLILGLIPPDEGRVLLDARDDRARRPPHTAVGSCSRRGYR